MSDLNPLPNSIAIGNHVFVPALFADGKIFHFTRTQQEFLYALQKMKSPEAAAIAVGQPDEWGQKFLSSRKFKSYLNSKLQSFSIRNGMNVEWWYQFGKEASDGYRESYSYKCLYCDYAGTMSTYEAEGHRTDDNDLKAECQCCFKPIDLKYDKQTFKPTREQLVAWQELGDRLIPKIERVHHQFENTEIIFQSEGEQ